MTSRCRDGQACVSEEAIRIISRPYTQNRRTREEAGATQPPIHDTVVVQSTLSPRYDPEA